jgi:hypothetical protein
MTLSDPRILRRYRGRVQEQLDAFPAVGKCARLVTTRILPLTAGTAVPVTVDQMTIAQARALLQHGLPPLPPAVADGLLAETGRWPLLLRLVNKILTSQATLGPGNVPAYADASHDAAGRTRAACYPARATVGLHDDESSRRPAPPPRYHRFSSPIWGE